MTTIILALSTSFLFGCSDFSGGIAARRDSSVLVTAVSHVTGGALLLFVVLLLPAATPGVSDILWGGVAGLSGGVGVASLYAGLSRGRMSIVVPTTAALSASIPAAFDLIRGSSVGPLAVFGMVLAIVAVVIVTLSSDEEIEEHSVGAAYDPRKALTFAIIAGIGFAGSFLSFSMTGFESGLWPILAARAVSITLIGGASIATLRRVRLKRNAVLPTLAAGIMDTMANVTMISAIRIGPLALAAVLGSLYPVVVVLLARTFLGERLARTQQVGVVIAVIAVVLTAS